VSFVIFVYCERLCYLASKSAFPWRLCGFAWDFSVLGLRP